MNLQRKNREIAEDVHDCSFITWNIIVKVAPMCLVYQAPLKELNINLPELVLPKLAYPHMLFILEKGYTANNAGQGKDK